MIAGDCMCGISIELPDDTTDVFAALQVWREEHDCPETPAAPVSIIERMADGNDPVESP